MSWANRSRPGHPEHPIGPVGQGWHLLELLGTDLVRIGPGWIAGAFSQLLRMSNPVFHLMRSRQRPCSLGRRSGLRYDR
jgi:hypothetical protein